MQDFKSSKLSNRLSILSTLWSSTLWVLTFCNLPCPWSARVCAKISNVRQDLRHALGCDLSSSPPKVVPKVGHARIVTKKTVATHLFYFLWPFLAFCFSSCFSCFRRCFRRWDFERVPGFKTSISWTFVVPEILGRLAFRRSSGSCHNSKSNLNLEAKKPHQSVTPLVLLQIFLWICLPLWHMLGFA